MLPIPYTATHDVSFLGSKFFRYCSNFTACEVFFPWFPSTKLVAICHIRGIIGESNIWQFALKMQLTSFLIGGFEYCMERNPCLQPKWYTFNYRYLCDLTNRQIKTTTKYTT